MLNKYRQNDWGDSPPPLPSLPFPPSLPLVTERIHSPFQPKQSPSKYIGQIFFLEIGPHPQGPSQATKQSRQLRGHHISSHSHQKRVPGSRYVVVLSYLRGVLSVYRFSHHHIITKENQSKSGATYGRK